MCFGPNTHENVHEPPMTQGIQQIQCSEAPHFKVLDLLKRLACKDDWLQCCYDENQCLKMLINQNEACQLPIGGEMINSPCSQCTVKDLNGNACVRHQECKKLEEELQIKTLEIRSWKMKEEQMMKF